MDMRKLLEAMTKFAGEPEQKPGDQVRGTEVAKPTKSGKKHPFQGRLVGSSESKENFLKGLNQVAEDTKVKRNLKDRWDEFKNSVTEDDLGVEPKRPSRKGSRPQRDMGNSNKPSKRYNYEKTESRGHDIVKQKLQDIERSKNPEPQADDLSSREARAKAEYAKYVAKMRKKNPDYIPLYKIDEAPTSQPGVPPAPQTGIPNSAGQTQADKEAAKKALAATTQLKAATGTKAPPNVMMKALDVATQGKAIDPKSSQVLEPMLDVVAAAATDPKLANQFKTLANQARTLQQQNQQQMK